MEADSLVQEITKPPLNLIILFFLSSERFLLTHDMNWKPHLIGKFTKSLFADSRSISIYEGRCASSQPASARLFHPRPPRGRQAGWRVGSQGRRGRPAKLLTPVSAALLSTWDFGGSDNFQWKVGFKEVLKRNIPCLLCLVSLRTLWVSHWHSSYLWQRWQ